MTTALWRRGRRLFSTAAILMILTAAVHTAGNLVSRPTSPGELNAFAVMDALRIPLGMGMEPSLKDIYTALVFTMSITLAGLGLLNLVLAATPDTTDRMLRGAGGVNLLWVTAFLILSWACRIPPPLISAAVIDVFVLAALFAPSPKA